MYKSREKDSARMSYYAAIAATMPSIFFSSDVVDHAIPIHDNNTLTANLGLKLTNIVVHAFAGIKVMSAMTRAENYAWMRAPLEFHDMEPKKAQKLAQYGTAAGIGLAFLAATQLITRAEVAAVKATGYVTPPPATETLPPQTAPTPRP